MRAGWTGRGRGGRARLRGTRSARGSAAGRPTRRRSAASCGWTEMTSCATAGSASPGPSPSSAAARHSTAGSSLDDAAASSSTVPVAGGNSFTWRRKCPCSRRPTGSRCGSGDRPASWPGVSCSASSRKASGLPPVSLMIRAATGALRAPETVVASRARAAAGSRPRRWRVGSPSSAVSAGEDARTPNSRPMLSAYSRRPTKARTSRDSRSSH